MKKIIVPLMMLFLASCSNPSSSSGISNDLSSIYVNPGIQESFSTQTYELYNQDCQQIYLLIVEGDSSYIKNKNTEEVVERFSNNDNPYLKGDYAYMIYVDDPEYSELYKHIAVIDDKLYDLDKEEFISQDNNKADNRLFNELVSIGIYKVYNQDCQAKYELVVEESTSYLQDIETKEVVETYYNDANPYLKGNYLYRIYVDDPYYSEFYKHISVVDDKLYDLDKEEFIVLDNGRGGDDVIPDDYLYDKSSYSSVPATATKCSYFSYFQKILVDEGIGFGDNSTNTCCLISMQILFGYYDTFGNDDIVAEYYDDEKYYPSLNWNDFPYSPTTYGELFHEYLMGLCYSYLDIDCYVDGTMTCSEQYSLIWHYLDDIREIEYTQNCSHGIIDILNAAQFDIVTDALDNGRPVIVNNHNHSMVAYAYDDDYMYVMTGYKGNSTYAKVLWNDFNGNIFTNYFCGAFDLVVTDHVCSDNYHSLLSGHPICPVCD